jgi:hypothetical protein
VSGGELVHGENNLLGQMVRELGLDTADVFSVFQPNPSRPEYEFFYLGTLSLPSPKGLFVVMAYLLAFSPARAGRERKLIGLHSGDADLKLLYKLIGELEENPPKEGDVSFMQVLRALPMDQFDHSSDPLPPHIGTPVVGRPRPALPHARPGRRALRQGTLSTQPLPALAGHLTRR